MYPLLYTGIFRGRIYLKRLLALSEVKLLASYEYSTRTILPRILISPHDALIDEKIQIRVTDLEQNQKITIKASVCENTQRFSSYGCFKADSSGVVDVTQHESSGGTYTGIDSMGLFWSMQQNPGQEKRLRLTKKDVTTPITVDLSVHKNHLSWEQLFEDELESIASTKVNRWYKAMNVKREKVKVGNIRGALFTPPGPGPFPTLIDVFGSAGGLIDYRASLLASRGFCVLALAFFMYEDLPKQMKDITLDYFKESVEWLSSLPQVTNGGIGFIGVSKGAELGILTALHCPTIKAIVNINGPPFCTFYPVKYGKELIPFTDLHFNLCTLFESGISSRNAFVVDDSNFFKTWTTDMKLLTLVCEQDMCFNPEYNHRFYNLIPEEKKKNYEIIEYQGAGHLLEPPYSPHCGASYHKILKTNVVWGGDPQGHNAAQVDAWQKVLHFFRTNIGSVQTESRN